MGLGNKAAGTNLLCVLIVQLEASISKAVMVALPCAELPLTWPALLGL